MIESKRKHAAVKYYCSAKCALDLSATRRVAKLLKDLSDDEIRTVLKKFQAD
jgi:hypothetical protein